MELQSVHVQGFRSARSAALEGCGPFNVLIGKNNSGKSTVLSAIDVFFECLRSQTPVALRPPIGDSIDFYKGGGDDPINIAVTFRMSGRELGDLAENITTDAPALREAVSGFEEDLQLRVTVTVPHVSERFAFVGNVALIKDGVSDRVLFSMAPTAAAEMRGRLAEIEQNERDAEAMRTVNQRTDESDWRRFTSTPAGGRPSFRYLTSRAVRVDLSPETDAIINDYAGAADSFADFRERVASHAGALSARAQRLQEAPLATPVRTYAGEEERVPGYVSYLLSVVAGINVSTFASGGAQSAERKRRDFLI